ncbi:MAG: 50S ribosomal protein L6 [Candidatus Kapaibacterium sp.]|jgi:large subunit ribosomal protein L6
MSRIGKKLITLPSGVTFEEKDRQLTIKGPKGILSETLPEGISFKLDGSELTFQRSSDVKQQRALHGLVRALTNNMIEGVTNGYVKKLEMVGVGFKAEKKGKFIQFNLGYSHPIILQVPAEITVDVPTPTTVTVTGIDKQLVGAVSAKIRSLRPPEPYKGKGVKYAGEVIIRKAGKTAGK